MATGIAKLDVDGNKQSIVSVNHTQSGGSSYTFNTGVTTAGLFTISQGDTPSTTNNQFITLQGNSSAGGVKTVSVKGNTLISDHLTVEANTTILGNLVIDEKTTLKSTLSVGGNTLVTDHLTVGANAIISHSLSIGTTIFVSDDITCASDLTFKTNIRPIENSLDKINKLRGVYFTWKTDEYPNFKKGTQVGMIAQEVKQVIPELIRGGNNPGDALSMSYDKMVAILVEGIKEINERISKLENKMSKN